LWLAEWLSALRILCFHDTATSSTIAAPLSVWQYGYQARPLGSHGTLFAHMQISSALEIIRIYTDTFNKNYSIYHLLLNWDISLLLTTTNTSLRFLFKRMLVHKPLHYTKQELATYNTTPW
jgi:hypothetical protein